MWILYSTSPYHRPSVFTFWNVHLSEECLIIIKLGILLFKKMALFKLHLDTFFCLHFCRLLLSIKIYNAKYFIHFSARTLRLWPNYDYIANFSPYKKTILFYSHFFLLILITQLINYKELDNIGKKWLCNSVPVYIWLVCFFQGNKYFKQGKYDEAIECYTKGMNADPYNPVLPTNRASAYFRMKK